MPGIAKIAFRIKASEQLNAAVDTLNCVVTSLLSEPSEVRSDQGFQLDLDAFQADAFQVEGGTTWSVNPTSNPASIYLDVLRGPANARPIADTRIDWDAWLRWFDEAKRQAWSFNAVYDFRSTLWQVPKDVSAAGRATPHMRDGLFSVLQDLPQTTPVQHLTPRNSWGFSAAKAFVDLPHGLKVRFIDPSSDWQSNERLVFRDGFDESNATK
jgi:hypothetical protein